MFSDAAAVEYSRLAREVIMDEGSSTCLRYFLCKSSTVPNHLSRPISSVSQLQGLSFRNQKFFYWMRQHAS